MMLCTVLGDPSLYSPEPRTEESLVQLGEEVPLLPEVPSSIISEVPAPPVATEVPATVAVESTDGDAEKARDLDLPAAENSVDFAE